MGWRVELNREVTDMKIVYGGVRGSYPVAAKDYLEFGGDTTAVWVEGDGGERILLDAGTGVRALADRWGPADAPVLILLTHYHLDHVAGLAQIPALYQRERPITIHGPVVGHDGPGELLPRLVAPPFWPISFRTMSARITCAPLPPDPLSWGRMTIRWLPVAHLGECVAYRLDEAGGGSLVFATDMEWAAAGEDQRRAFMRFCREPAPARILCFDGAYTSEEYSVRRGWGHSTWEEAVAVGRLAGVEEVHVIHHAPEHDDRFLTDLDRAVRALWSRARLARGGEVCNVG